LRRFSPFSAQPCYFLGLFVGVLFLVQARLPLFCPPPSYRLLLFFFHTGQFGLLHPGDSAPVTSLDFFTYPGPFNFCLPLRVATGLGQAGFLDSGDELLEPLSFLRLSSVNFSSLLRFYQIGRNSPLFHPPTPHFDSPSVLTQFRFPFFQSPPAGEVGP